jgi:hypothetical protein
MDIERAKAILAQVAGLDASLTKAIKDENFAACGDINKQLQALAPAKAAALAATTAAAVCSSGSESDDPWDQSSGDEDSEPAAAKQGSPIMLVDKRERGYSDAAIASALGQQVEPEEAAPRAPNIMDLPMMNVVAPQGKVSSLLEFCTPRPTRERAGICIRALRFPH